MSLPEVESWLQRAPASQQTVLRELRAIILSSTDDVFEQFKWGRPWYSTEQGLICYLHSTSRHATIGFKHGKHLQDPAGVLLGSGREMRHINFGCGDEPDTEVVWALVRAAFTARTPSAP